MHAVRIVGLLAFALLFVNAATAQVPAPKATITLTVPAGPTDVKQGGNASLDVTVSITLSNVVCNAAGTVTVHLAAKEEPSPLPGITGTLPATAVFNIDGPKAYTEAGNGAFTGTATKKLNITVAAGTLPNHDHAFNITASFATGDLSSQCTPSPTQVPGATPPFGDSKTASTAIKTGPALAGTTGGNTTVSNTGSMTTTKKSFALPLALEVIGLLALGMVASRRKQ